MIRYEVLFLTVPEVTLDEAHNLETQLRSIVRDLQGNSISFERWGKYRLAYLVQKNEYGVYFLFRFEIEQQGLPQFSQAVRSIIHLKFGDVVMRYVVNRLADQALLTYQRPDSLEEVPGRTTDALMREHKIAVPDEGDSDDMMSDSITAVEA
jgi:small subunit ribosomal protein S6